MNSLKNSAKVESNISTARTNIIMDSLKDSAKVESNISTARTNIIKALHKFIFEEEGDRGNRKRIRNFKGFLYDEKSEGYDKKSKYVDENLNKADLVSICNVLELDYNNSDLKLTIFRNLMRGKLLQDHEQNIDDDGDNNDDDNSDDEQESNLDNDDRNSASAYNDILEDVQSAALQSCSPRFALSFQDVEDSVRSFDGSESYPVEVWIREFEEIAKIMKWDDLQKFVFAKKSLKGLAKLYIESEKHIFSWKNLKSSLLEEFKTHTNSAKLHQMLCERKLKRDETIIEYFLKIKEIANRGNVEDNAIMQYVIDGISDLDINKTILYGARSMSEFKEKLRLYESIRKKNKRVEVKRTEFKKNEKDARNERKNRQNDYRCYSCGEKGHASKFCHHKEKGMKCFKCGQFGHISNNCQNDNAAKSNMLCLNSKSVDVRKKIIKVKNRSLTALIDTGSKYNIIKEDIYSELENTALNETDIYLVGFVKSEHNKIKPIGSFEVDVEIDGLLFNLKFLVVPSECMDYEMIIGNEIFEKAEIIINPSGMSIKKLETEEDKEIHAIMNISEYIENIKIDIDENVKPETRITCSSRLISDLKKDVDVDDDHRSSFQDDIVMKIKANDNHENINNNGKNKMAVSTDDNVVFHDDNFKTSEKDNCRLDGDERIFDVDVDYDHDSDHCKIINAQIDEQKFTSITQQQEQFTTLNNCIIGDNNYCSNNTKNLSSAESVLSEKSIKSTNSVSRPRSTSRDSKLSRSSKSRSPDLNNFRETRSSRSRSRSGSRASERSKSGSKKSRSRSRSLGSKSRSRSPSPNEEKVRSRSGSKNRSRSRSRSNTPRTLRSKSRSRSPSANESKVIGRSRSGSRAGSIDGKNDGVINQELENNKSKSHSRSKSISPPRRSRSKSRRDSKSPHNDANKNRSRSRSKSRSISRESRNRSRSRSGSRNGNVSRRSRSGSRRSRSGSVRSRSGSRRSRSGSRIKRAQQDDEDLKLIKEILKLKPYDDYILKEEVLYKFEDGQDLLVIPKMMQMDIIRKAHDRGHFSAKKTKELISRDYFIPKLEQKIMKCISSCIPCILVNRKSGKHEGELHPLFKDDTPLYTYHIDFLGPLESTNKNYNHIFAVIDAFTKFVWLYPTKSTSSKDAIDKLELQKKVFGNPAQLISDRGSAFTSTDFKNYCEEEGIKHLKITTGLPRANGQVERLNSVIISVLSKLSIEDPSKWYKHVDKVQQAINSTFHRSIKTTPFEMLIGTKMITKDDVDLKKLIEDESTENFKEARENLRKDAKEQIFKVQEENRKSYNLRRRKAIKYKKDELVAIKKTQFGVGSKLKPKFMGPYRVVKVKGNDTYDLVKEGNHEGPTKTTSCAEFMKYWSSSDEDDTTTTFETNVSEDGRDVGSGLATLTN